MALVLRIRRLSMDLHWGPVDCISDWQRGFHCIRLSDW